MPTITVTNTNDSGAGSLRAALAAAGAGDTIAFDAALSGQLIRLTSGTLTANIALTIDGDINNDGKADITISGDASGDDVHIAGSTTITDAVQSNTAGKLVDNVQVIVANAALTVDGLIITGGKAGFGGGLLAMSTLAMTNSLVAGNQANQSGGGIDVLGAATVSNSTISGNMAQFAGGFLAQASATLTNVTISGNSATAYGGAASNGALTLVNSTVTGNSALLGGGVVTPGGTLTLTNSIVLGNSAFTVAEVNSNGPIVYTGLNIVGIGGDTNASDGVINALSLEAVFASVAANPFTGVTAGGLADNGGSVPTVALRAYSGNPAIDQALVAAPLTDARAIARYDVAGYAGLADIGAFEAQNVGVPTNTLPAGQAVNEDGSLGLSGGSAISIAQPNGLTLTVSLSVLHGAVTLASLAGLTVMGGANGSGAISIRGTVADLNTALGGLSYAPATNYNGPDTLTVATSDGNVTDQDALSITVNPVNDTPTAADDTASLAEGELRLGNVLDNDADVDAGQSLTVTAIAGGTVGQALAGQYGTLTLQADGIYAYIADNGTLPQGQQGTDTFTYTVSDGNGGTATADLVMTVTGGALAPPAGGQPWAAAGANAVSEGTGDFDGNDTLDFLWRDTSTNAVELWTSDANGAVTVASLGTIGANWSFETVGDLDGDGTDDVVFRDTATGKTGAWIMQDGVASDWRDLGTLGAQWQVSGAGDFDGNGTDDLLLLDSGTGSVDVWTQGVSGPGSQSTIGTAAAGWTVAGIGDLDGNGTDDVLFFNTATRQVGAWQMEQGEAIGWYDYGTIAAGWTVTEIGNFDGSGAEDIGFYNAAGGADGAWTMFDGAISGWLAKPSHDALDPIGAGTFASASEQILWHNTATGAVVTF